MIFGPLGKGQAATSDAQPLYSFLELNFLVIGYDMKVSIGGR
jgi:hypothetical protein